MTWTPVKHYVEHEMKIAHTDKEPLFFDNYDANALQNIINTQHKVIDYMFMIRFDKKISIDED